MPSHLLELFKDRKIVTKIKKRLPKIFQIAEIESSRAGRIGMEVGCLRERMLIALLIYKFGEANVDDNIPITEPEKDVELFGEPISIKTSTSLAFKLIWTVDITKAKEFLRSYYPTCHMLFAYIKWRKKEGLYYIPLTVQRRVFSSIGRDRYIKLPKEKTNPRGVEINKEALAELLADKETKKIDVEWKRARMQYNPCKRWIDFWR